MCAFDGALRGVVEIKVGVQGVDEAETDWVGTGWWLIGAVHALAEPVENAMRLSRILILGSGKPSLVMPWATAEMAPETAPARTGLLGAAAERLFQRP